MTRKLLIAVALVLGIVSVLGFLVGCDKVPNPTTPTPTVCEDPKAFNNGGQLPCRYTFVSIDAVTPASGSTIDYSEIGTTRRASVNYSYEFDPNIPGAVGFQVFFSADCVSVVGGYNMAIFSRTSGMFSQAFLSLPRSSGIKQTKCMIVRMVSVDSNSDVIGIITEAKRPWVFNLE